MTVLSAVQGACPLMGLDVPTEVYGSLDPTMIEIQQVTNDVAEGIAKAYDWSLLHTLATYTGDGSTEDFSLPTDYSRMPKKAQLWSSSLETPLSPIPDIDRWLGLDVQSFDFVVNAWIIYGGQFHIKPALASAVTAKHYYQSNLIVQPEEGSNKMAFTVDTDIFRLDERLLKLGIVSRWREIKGLPYAEEMDRFEDLKSKLMSEDKGSRIIRVGRVRRPRGTNEAYPQSITP